MLRIGRLGVYPTSARPFTFAAVVLKSRNQILLSWPISFSNFNKSSALAVEWFFDPEK
jgi:hypothetical protein